MQAYSAEQANQRAERGIDQPRLQNCFRRALPQLCRLGKKNGEWRDEDDRTVVRLSMGRNTNSQSSNGPSVDQSLLIFHVGRILSLDDLSPRLRLHQLTSRASAFLSG